MCGGGKLCPTSAPDARSATTSATFAFSLSPLLVLLSSLAFLRSHSGGEMCSAGRGHGAHKLCKFRHCTILPLLFGLSVHRAEPGQKSWSGGPAICYLSSDASVRSLAPSPDYYFADALIMALLAILSRRTQSSGPPASASFNALLPVRCCYSLTMRASTMQALRVRWSYSSSRGQHVL